MASIPEYQTPAGAKKTGAMDRFLTTIERVGNKVPHPGIIAFLILIGTSLSCRLFSASWEPRLLTKSLIRFRVILKSARRLCAACCQPKACAS